MKAANITLVFKKDDHTDKENCKQFTILPNLSNVLESGIYNKCHILLLTNKNVIVNIGIGQIQNNSFKKLLGNTIDSKINTKDHIGNICKKPVQNALTRVSVYRNPDKKYVL